ncbi:kinase-like domain-containing protein [Microdochium bolleyi]|uniref:non-specific serine/threonine protein kinase n=1 Tax=Microdochium bolleyi TaxID=196109 RepID=A0A136IUA0_9PEZI|nr:kinase-like domain-containing protein [Microdochium bolleyi]
MASSLLGWLPRLGRSWEPLDFAHASCSERVPLDHKIDEDCLSGYFASGYHPVRLVEVLRDQYQIVGKLGFGATSTIWLVCHLCCWCHVAIKLFVHSRAMGSQLHNEVQMCRRMSLAKINHPGRSAVRELLDSSDIPGPDGRYRCLVHRPLADNILFGIEDDDPVFEASEQGELQSPSPRTELDGEKDDIDLQRASNQDQTEDCQRRVYRASEVILEAPWDHKIDIWNTGCMVWDMFQGFHLFPGHDAEHQTYRGRAHLSDLVAVLGKPPASLLSVRRPDHQILLRSRQRKEYFIAIMDRMLRWDPIERSSAADLARDG